MAKHYAKQVLSSGQYHSPDGLVNVTPERLRQWEEKFNHVTSGLNYKIPVHFDHQDPETSLPVPADEFDARKRMGASSTVGHVAAFRSLGDKAELVIETDHPQAIEAIEKNRVFVSPVLFDQWTAGQGAKLSDVIGAVDLVDLPVDFSQGPFEPVRMSTISKNAADEAALSVIRMATAKGTKTLVKGEEEESEDEPSWKKNLTEYAKGKKSKKNKSKMSAEDEEPEETEENESPEGEEEVMETEGEEEGGEGMPAPGGDNAPEEDGTLGGAAGNDDPTEAVPEGEVDVSDVNAMTAGNMEAMGGADPLAEASPMAEGTQADDYLEPMDMGADSANVAEEIKQNLLAIGIVAPEGVDILSDPLGFARQLVIALKQKHMDSGGVPGSYEYPDDSDMAAMGGESAGGDMAGGDMAGEMTGAMGGEGQVANASMDMGQDGITNMPAQAGVNDGRKVTVDETGKPGAASFANKKKYDEKDLQEEQPGYLTMSTDSPSMATLMSTITDARKAEIGRQLDNLLKTGRCTPDEFDRHSAALKQTKMSVDPRSGACSRVETESFIENRKVVRAGSCWPSGRRMSTAPEGAETVYETSPPDILLEGAVDESKAKRVVDEMEKRHPGRFKKSNS